MAKSVNSIDKLVGRNVRIFRQAKGMSQTALGDALGVTFQQIQKYEKGVSRIGASRLAAITKVLDVPISRLFDIAAIGPLPGPVVTDLLTVPYAVEMLQAFAKLSDNGVRRSLTALTESIAEQVED